MGRSVPMKSSLPASAQHAPTLPESAWLQHRHVLHELYICHNRTLNEVKRTMEEEHGFPVMRPHDYEVALRENLGLRKNLKGQDWQAIKAHWDLRRIQGKKSNVLWNDMIVGERKIRKEIHRKRKRSHLFSSRLGIPPLPPGVIIKTPPLSPTTSKIVLLAPNESRLDPVPISPAESGPLTWMRYNSTARWNCGIAFLEPDQVIVSRFQELRKECPFNVFIGKLLDISDSYHLLNMVPVECAQAPRPRLLGINPSWELLARITFDISNNLEMDWTAPESSWFLNWFGVSADLMVLRAFFSIPGPTVCALYENLFTRVFLLRRSSTAKVLFHMLETIRGNSPMLADSLNFLDMAIYIGSTSDGMLDIAEWAIEHHLHVLDDAAVQENLWLSYLWAASRRDTVMLRLLVDAGARPNAEAPFDIHSPYSSDECTRTLQTIIKLFSWSRDDDNDINDFVQLLIKGGLLVTELRPRCYNTDRACVELLCGPIQFDEAIMLCPAIKRKTLYNAIMDCSGESQTSVRHAGIFTAAAESAPTLDAYIQSFRPDYDFDTLATMQESLVFATLLNDTQTMSALLQLGTDPSAGLLQSNKQRYAKGSLPWNPMVIAAAAGNKEALMLLKEWSNLDAFLTFLECVPVYEIVRQKTDRCGPTFTELERLDEIFRNLLYNPSVYLYSKVMRANRLELLAWIRSNAVAHGLVTNFDEEVIATALLNTPEIQTMRRLRWLEDHYCDVLLLDGLVDANLEYHKSGMDLLQLSIRNRCSLEVVEFLLSKGFKVHSRPTTGTETQHTILQDALLSRSPDRCQIVQLLLDRGADCKKGGTESNLLEDSLDLEPSLDLLESLLDVTRRAQKSPRQDCLDIFQRLLNEGAPYPPEPQRLMQLLICAGASDQLILHILDNIREAQKQGSTPQTADLTWLPLVEAISQRRETLARELIRQGADVNVLTDVISFGDSLTALQAACRSGSSLGFIKHLVEQGADVNGAPSRFGNTALQWCTSLNVLELLLDNYADVNALSGMLGFGLPGVKSAFRRRALDMAAESGRLDMLEYLLKVGGRSVYGGLRGSILLARDRRHFAVLSVLLDWDRKHGSRIVEEEAKWQREHPDLARLVSRTEYVQPAGFIARPKPWEG